MAKLQALNIQTVSGHAYEELSRAIVNGTLKPKEVLNDRKLCEHLGVSRTPIREALRLLEGSGLVERRGRSGWIVADLNLRDIEELFELRILLETAGVRRVVDWSDKTLKALAAMFDGFHLPLDSLQKTAYLKQDHFFHQRLVEATQNTRITKIYKMVELQIDRVRHFVSYRKEGRVEQSLQEHKKLCRKLLSRDTTAASRALEAHILNVKTRLVEMHPSAE